jgi:hypothetical protein
LTVDTEAALVLGYHFKTGQRNHPQDQMMLYRAGRHSGKHFRFSMQPRAREGDRAPLGSFTERNWHVNPRVTKGKSAEVPARAAEEKAKNVACGKWMSNHSNWLEETNRSKLWSIVSFIQSVSVCKRFNNIDLEVKSAPSNARRNVTFEVISGQAN